MATAAKRKRTDEPVGELDFSKPWKMSDVVLLVEGQRFHVHRNVLALWSPVFEKMFTSNFSEKKKGEIRLPGKGAASVKSLLLMIYPPSKEEVTSENWNGILELAHEYQINSIVNKCEEFLKETLSRNDEIDVISTLILAQNFKLESLRERCIVSSMDLTLKEIQDHELFDEIEMENYIEVLDINIRLKQFRKENSPSKETLQGIQKRGFKKLDEIAKVLLKHISHKNSMESRDLNAVAKDDGVEAFLLALKLDNRPHSCPDMDNIVCPSMGAVSHLLKQLKGLFQSITEGNVNPDKTETAYMDT